MYCQITLIFLINFYVYKHLFLKVLIYIHDLLIVKYIKTITKPCINERNITRNSEVAHKLTAKLRPVYYLEPRDSALFQAI